MIIKVDWQYVILDAGGSAGSGYRVKRRVGGSAPPPSQSGTSSPNSDSWQSAPAPASIPYNNENYIFAFWSVMATDITTQQRTAHIQGGPSRIASDSHYGGMWEVVARAYYFWDFGIGAGNHALLIDAFDLQAGDFLGDDFVDVLPNLAIGNKTITQIANDGYIDTTAQVAAAQSLTVTARASLAGTVASPAPKRFGWWEQIILISATQQQPATVGAPGPQDIVVHQNDIVVAIAMYNRVEVITPWVPPARTIDIFRTGWWHLLGQSGFDGIGIGFPPGGGPPVLIPPRPAPSAQQGWLALWLAQAAPAMSPELQQRALELAADQLKRVAEEMGREAKGLGK